MNFVLASASPRRKQLLEQIGIVDFEVIPSDMEETITKTTPSLIVEELSFQKCMDISKQVIQKQADNRASDPDYIVIGADTIVADGKRILGKPSDKSEAFHMLSTLAGHAHSVFTGVTLCRIQNGKIQNHLTFHNETLVYMRAYTASEIQQYIATGEPMDKAGAYGIQGRGAVLVERIDGDYNNVVGLPLSHLNQAIKEICK